MVAVAGEALLVVEVFVEHSDGVLAAHAGPCHAPGGLVAHALQRFHVSGGVERGVFDTGDRQRRRGQGFARRVHGVLEIGGDLDAARWEMERVFHCRDCNVQRAPCCVQRAGTCDVLRASATC